MNQLKTTTNTNILVLGGNVLSLTTALKLQEKFPKGQITVSAPSFETNSPGVEIFWPRVEEENRDFLQSILEKSWRYFDDLIQNESATLHGTFQVPFYQLQSSPKLPHFADIQGSIFEVHRECTDKELNLFKPSNRWLSGSYSHTIAISLDRYQKYLISSLKAKGVSLVEEKVTFREKAAGDYDVIVDFLCCEEEFAKERVTKVKAPWIKLVFAADNDLLIIPGIDYVEIRSSVEIGSGSELWNKLVEIIPNLEAAERQEEFFDFKPSSDEIKIQKETVNGKLKVIRVTGQGRLRNVASPGIAEVLANCTKI